VHNLTNLTPVEKALLQETEEPGIAATAIKFSREDLDGGLSQIVVFLKDGTVRYELLKRSPHLMPLALARWGVDGAVVILYSLTDVDRRLVEAAELVGTAAALRPRA